MIENIKKGFATCKIITRNGYEAYIINPPLQMQAMELSGRIELDVATDVDLELLLHIFPEALARKDKHFFAELLLDDIKYFFYTMNDNEASYTETCISRFTPRLGEILKYRQGAPVLASPLMPPQIDENDGFESFDKGYVSLTGIPDENLKQNYMRAIKALRYSANYNLPLETNTYWAIIRAARKVGDYASFGLIMEEWRKVEAENMWKFADLLFKTMILHKIIPELSCLSRIMQPKNPKKPEEGEESVWTRTLNTMRFYPEEMPYDWFGTFACLFHNVGKFYAAEYFDNDVTFTQHQQVGAKITRKIAHRLLFEESEATLLSHLVRHHMRFRYMLNDKGIRRFKALQDYPRLIEMARADVKARNGNFTEFNHNMKMLSRTNVEEDQLEPLLNGEQIMELANIKPGPTVGLIREALLQAQIKGDVEDIEQARKFVCEYKKSEKL